MGFGKYHTKEQKDLFNQIQRVTKRMAHHRKAYLEWDVKRSVLIAKLREAGAEYKRRF